MRHEDFRRQLDDLVDGIVGEPERLEMEQHAAGCPECARELEAVRAVVDSARALPRDIEPARDLWRGIEAEVRSPAAPQPRWPHFMRPRLRLAFAGGFAVLLVLAVIFARRFEAPPVPASAVDFASLLPASLSGLELECMGTGRLLQAALRLPVATPARETAESLAPGLVDGLSILDRSIEETRAALATTPDSLELQCLLATRYQQKLALLQSALMRVEAT